MTCRRPDCAGCTFCDGDAPEPMTPGLHVAAQDYTHHPGAGSHVRLEVAALRAAIACLTATGETGIAVAVMLLSQQIDEISGPPIPELRDPDDTSPRGISKIYGDSEDGDEFRPATLPFFGFRGW